MDAVAWVKAKGPIYIGLEAGATICLVLIALTVLKITNASYGLSIEAAALAAVAVILATAGMTFDKSS